MQTLPLPSKIGQIFFAVPKDAQFSKTDENKIPVEKKTIVEQNFYFLIWFENANEWDLITSRFRVSIQKYAESRGAAPVGGVGGEVPHKPGGLVKIKNDFF